MDLFQVNLLDPKRSMNVNIFIRQLRISNLDLVEKLRQCNSEVGVTKIAITVLYIVYIVYCITLYRITVLLHYFTIALEIQLVTKLLIINFDVKQESTQPIIDKLTFWQ